MQTYRIRDEFIKLGQALKAAGMVESGVESKRSDTGRSGHGKWRDRYTPRT